MTDTASIHMSTAPTPSLRERAAASPLRAVLAFDAAVTATNGIAYLVLAGPLGDLLGVPSGILRGVGAFLTVYALLVVAVTRPTRPNPTAVRELMVANVAWVVASAVAAATDWHDLTAAGTAWILAQAAVVAAITVGQARGLRR